MPLALSIHTMEATFSAAMENLRLRDVGWESAKFWLAVLPVLLIFGPLLPGLYWALAPALDASVWRALWLDTQWPQALRATLISSVLSTVLAFGIAALLATLHYPGAVWAALQRRLPVLLSVPHAAFAIGLFFLIAPSGWLARAVAYSFQWISPPDWGTVQDRYGLSLALALAIKESWFLLWVLAAVLGEQAVSRQMVMGRSLGYSRAQTWMLIVWPQLLPRLVWPVLAVFAYGLSVVDMAVILGPGTPPTLAVLVWHWLTDPNPELQARGSAASLVLLFVLLGCAATVRGAWWLWLRRRPYPMGQRRAPSADQSALVEAAHRFVFHRLRGGGGAAAVVFGTNVVFSGALARLCFIADLATSRLDTVLDHPVAGPGSQYAVFARGAALAGVGAKRFECAAVPAVDPAGFATGGGAIRHAATLAT